MDFINARSCRLQLLEDFRRKKIPQTTFVFQPPEPEYFFNKTLDQVAAFHMTLLAEKMDQGIPAVGDFIDFGGYIAQSSLGPDLVEIDRQKLGQLLDQVVDRLNVGVEQFGHFFLEEVGVPDAGAPQLQVDDQGRKEGAAPFGVASDKVQPDPHIDQGAGVADQLPSDIDSFHPRALKTEM